MDRSLKDDSLMLSIKSVSKNFWGRGLIFFVDGKFCDRGGLKINILRTSLMNYPLRACGQKKARTEVLMIDKNLKISSFSRPCCKKIHSQTKTSLSNKISKFFFSF
jgi:hypothetical protein